MQWEIVTPLMALLLPTSWPYLCIFRIHSPFFSSDNAFVINILKYMSWNIWTHSMMINFWKVVKYANLQNCSFWPFQYFWNHNRFNRNTIQDWLELGFCELLISVISNLFLRKEAIQSIFFVCDWTKEFLLLPIFDFGLLWPCRWQRVYWSTMSEENIYFLIYESTYSK